MKKLLIMASLLYVAFGGYAQQEAQFTQFMYNKLTLNPAYAGSAERPCISCIHRSQWMGLEGAPSSQALNFHLPMFKKRVGLGASILHDKIGPTNSYSFSLMYAYRMQIGKGNLSVGLKGTLRSYQIAWEGLRTTHEGDGRIPMENVSRVFPNFGVGVYYENNKFFAGLSVPNLLNNDLSYAHFSNNTDFGKEFRHSYLMAGYLFEISKKLKFKPAVLAKYVANSPFDLDLNATFIFMDKIWLGTSYRLGGNANSGIGESIDFLMQYQLTKAIRAGISYDFTLSDIKDYTSGTVEIQLEYCIQPKDERWTNPRFF